MLKAIALGTLAQSALLLSGLLVYRIHFSPRFVGVLAGFGAGALIEAVAFDLVAEAQALDSLQFAVWMLVGAAILLIGDAIVDRRFGGGGAMGIVVGSVVDGVPESAIFGIQIATGFPISIGFFGAVFVSNFPQAIAPSADLAKGGVEDRSTCGHVGARLGRLWCRIGPGVPPCQLVLRRRR